MVERTLIVNAPSDIFLDWCYRRKEEWCRQGLAWPTERGEVRLWGGGGVEPNSLEVRASHFVFVSDTEERVSPPWTVIEIRTIPLATERCEVQAACRDERARPLFEELLGAIGERWPESGLAKTGGAATQEQAAKPGLRGEARLLEQLARQDRVQPGQVLRRLILTEALRRGLDVSLDECCIPGPAKEEVRDA